MLIINVACWCWRASTSWHGNIFRRFFSSAVLQEISPSFCVISVRHVQLSDALLCEWCVAAEVEQKTDRLITQSLQVSESVFTDVDRFRTARQSSICCVVCVNKPQTLLSRKSAFCTKKLYLYYHSVLSHFYSLLWSHYRWYIHIYN